MLLPDMTSVNTLFAPAFKPHRLPRNILAAGADTRAAQNVTQPPSLKRWFAGEIDKFEIYKAERKFRRFETVSRSLLWHEDHL